MIISVVNNKGGVGKTTVSVNLSNALAIEKKKVLTIDLDPQSHATFTMGIDADKKLKTIGDVMMSIVENRFIFYYHIKTKDIIIPTFREGLDLIPSKADLVDALEPLYKSQRFFKFTRYTLMEQCLNPIKDSYDYIIIDCPPGLGVLTLNAIKASDCILAPCETSSSSVLGLNNLLDKVRELKGESFDKYKMLYSMIDHRCKTSVDSTAEQLDGLAKYFLKSEIKRSDLLNQCQFKRKDIFTMFPSSDAAKNYIDLANEIMKLWKV